MEDLRSPRVADADHQTGGCRIAPGSLARDHCESLTWVEAVSGWSIGDNALRGWPPRKPSRATDTISYWIPRWACKLKKKIKPKAFLFRLITIYAITSYSYVFILLCSLYRIMKLSNKIRSHFLPSGDLSQSYLPSYFFSLIGQRQGAGRGPIIGSGSEIGNLDR